MKIIAAIFFLAIFINAKAQQETFLKIFTGSSYEEGIKSFRLPNKSYRIIGNTGTYGWGQKNIWMIALDSNGNFIWHKTYGKGGLDFAEDAQMDAKGNIYIVGSSSSQTINTYQMLLVGVDTNGYAFTYSYFGGPDWDFGRGIQLIGDTVIMLVGQTYSYSNSQSDAWIVKVTTTGQEIWSSSVGGASNESFSAIKQMPDGSFIAAGYSTSYGNGTKDGLLYHCTENGDSLWFVTYHDTTDGEFNDLLINPDTNIIVAGYQRDTADSYQDISLMNFSINGQINWNRVSLRQKEDASIKSIIGEGDYYITSGISTKYGRDMQNIYGNRLDKGGWWNSTYFFGGQKNDYSNSIVADTSNGQIHYLVTGTTRSYGLNFSAVIFIRMDSNFYADTVPSIMIPSGINNASNFNNFEVRVYPNPFSDKVNVVVPQKIKSEVFYIEVNDALGKLIYIKKVNSNTKRVELETGSWQKGLYFITLKSSRNVFRNLLIKN